MRAPSPARLALLERHVRPLRAARVDLARAADGRWWVVGDRTDAPIGLGYALENRIVASRMLPNIIRECHVERLAHFFLSVQEMLRGLAPEHRHNPRIVLLSQGPSGPNYFEDAYLARYLGYTLVESGDLAVRDDRVYLKTLSGLLAVDVILRRLSDEYCDPLEIRTDNYLGVAGLLQASRLGNVAIVNSLGTSLVESLSLWPFLAGIAAPMLEMKKGWVISNFSTRRSFTSIGFIVRSISPYSSLFNIPMKSEYSWYRKFSSVVAEIFSHSSMLSPS